MYWHELTGREKALIRRTVKNRCANYDRDLGCLRLDTDCYMFGIGFRESSLCKYFERAVLPSEPELLELFRRNSEPMKKCAVCGRPFVAVKNRRYCSEKCAEEARRKAVAARVRKYRQQHM